MAVIRKPGVTGFRAALVAAGLAVALGVAWAADEKRTVGQKNKEFTTAELTVKPGERVTFENNDEIAHNVFCNHKDCKFNTKIQAPGSKTEVTFEREGSYQIRCAIHPKMKLTVHVKK